MNYTSLFQTFVLAIALGTAPTVCAQTVRKPLNEPDPTNAIDKLGGGDPIRTSPSDSVIPVATPRPKSGKEEKPAKADRSKNGETEITADEGSFDQHTHQAIFSKRVFVKNPDFSVKCDKLTAF